MANFKGTIYTSTALFAEKTFGPDAIEHVLEALPMDDQRVLRGATAVGWYPAAPVMSFHRKLDELYGRGDLSLCLDVGKFSAEWTLNAVLKMVLRLRTPNWLMERSTSLWERFHDSGRWELQHNGPVPLLAQLHDFEVRDSAFCVRFSGWLHGAIALTGGKEPEVAHPKCVCTGDPYCQFEGSWR